jgi:hypothetical protein
MKLRISDDLSLPSDTQTSTLVVYGGKGMGKTNFGSVLVEEHARAGLRFSVIDPLDSVAVRNRGAGADPVVEKEKRVIDYGPSQEDRNFDGLKEDAPAPYKIDENETIELVGVETSADAHIHGLWHEIVASTRGESCGLRFRALVSPTDRADYAIELGTGYPGSERVLLAHFLVLSDKPLSLGVTLPYDTRICARAMRSAPGIGTVLVGVKPIPAE